TTRAEHALKGKRLEEAVNNQAAQLAAEAADPAADLRGSVEDKRDLVRVLAGRAIRKALERAGQGRGGACRSRRRSTARRPRQTAKRVSASRTGSPRSSGARARKSAATRPTAAPAPSSSTAGP